MWSHGPKTSKPTRPPNQSSKLPSLSSHLAMVELKQRILNSLSKLADRDTSHIAVEELEGTIQSLQNDAVPMLLNCLFDASTSDPKPAVRKESMRLLAILCGSHPDSTSTHLVKIVSHIAKRLRDTDSGVRDACRETFGSLSGIFLHGEGENGVVSLFMRPLFEAMGENHKVVQVGAAMCLGRVVECAKNPPVPAFQKLSPRICKYLSSPNCVAKSALLSVISTLSQVGMIVPQSFDPLLQCILECLASADWATRKAAADTLIALALYSSDLIKDGAASTLTTLEASRFDKIKPVRDSITEALQLWKKIAGRTGNGSPDEQKTLRNGEFPERNIQGAAGINMNGIDSSPKDSSNALSSSDSVDKIKNGTLSDKNVGILKKKMPAFTDKELNPEFFQKLENRVSDELCIEVVVPRKVLPSDSHEAEQDEKNSDVSDKADKVATDGTSKQQNIRTSARDRLIEDKMNVKDLRGRGGNFDDDTFRFSKPGCQPDGSFMNDKGNWLAIQRQLLQLERQQVHVMNMLQDFMGGSHEGMITLESRVRGLERVVEEMAQDLSISSGRRTGNFRSGFEGSSTRSRYSGFFDYGSKVGRNSDGRPPFGDRCTSSDGFAASGRRRGPPWRSNVPDSWDIHSYGASRAGQMGARRDVGSNHVDGRSPKSEHQNDQSSGHRVREKVVEFIRLGDNPSARNVWQASKDAATLQAIRVAGEDGGPDRTARVPIPEMTTETVGNDNSEQERDAVWTSWINAMDADQGGDMDTAYAEVLSTADDLLLVKLMDRSGPVLDQLSNEVAVELLNAVTPLLMEHNLFDLCLHWLQQLVDIVMENGPDVFGIPMEVKRELLFYLHDASSTIKLPEDWEGAAPEQLMLQLVSAWGLDLQQHGS